MKTLLTSLLSLCALSLLAQSKFKALNSHAEMVNCVAISPDEAYFASGSNDNKIFLFKTGGERIREWTAHAVGVKSMVFTPNGKQLISGGRDGSIKVWDIPSGKLAGSLSGHKASVSGLAISPDAKTLYSVSDDYTLKTWNLKKGSEVRSFDCKQGRLQTLAISSDGKYLATGAGNKLQKDPSNLKVWQSSTGKLVYTLEEAEYAIMAVAFIPGSTELAYAGIFKQVKAIDYLSGESKGSWTVSNFGVHSLDASQNGKWIYAGTTYDFNVMMISRSRNLVARMPGHKAYVNALRLAPEGGFLVSGDNDGKVHLWPFK